MALANVAALLAKNGRRVVMVDFDLEAPGLDCFEEFQIENACPGMVEYVTEYIRTGKASRVTPFVHEIRPPEVISGKLWLMTAGCKDEPYNRKRVAINWTEFYEIQGGALFFENFKADIEDTFRPDYVLVDSRTGLTDVGGVCTLHLPDLVVLLFALNEQNLQGTASVARVLRDSDKAPQLLPVATPVPNLPRDSESFLEERYQRAKDLLGVDVELSIGYSPQISLRERIYGWKGGAIADQYKLLAESVSKADPGGLDFLLRQVKQAINAFDLDQLSEIESSLEEKYSDRADAWLSVGDIRKMRGDASGYENALLKALDVEPGNVPAFSRLESLLTAKKRSHDLTDIVKSLLERRDLLVRDRENDLIHKLGELLMQKGSPADAFRYFSESFYMTKNEASEVKGLHILVPAFNMAEAARRASLPPQGIWQSIIDFYESAAAGVNSSSLPDRLNYLQAMHIPYACAGNIDRALNLLSEVEKLALHVSPRERVFCVATYDRVNRDEFLTINRQMREALERGELWDGMKLTFSR